MTARVSFTSEGRGVTSFLVRTLFFGWLMSALKILDGFLANFTQPGCAFPLILARFLNFVDRSCIQEAAARSRHTACLSIPVLGRLP